MCLLCTAIAILHLMISLERFILLDVHVLVKDLSAGAAGGFEAEAGHRLRAWRRRFKPECPHSQYECSTLLNT